MVLDEAVRYFEEGSAERAFAIRAGAADSVTRAVIEAVRESVRLNARPPQAARIVALVRDGYQALRQGDVVAAKRFAAQAEQARRAIPEAPGLPEALAAKAVTDLLSEAAEALQRAADHEASKA